MAFQGVMLDANARRAAWILDPDVAFLNHGSFGACPRPVLEAQAALRERLEREPVRFMARDLEGLLDGARSALAELVRAHPDDLAFVPNASTGVSTVLRSLPFTPGDELLTTDHVYPACRNALEAVAASRGAVVRVASVPFPIASPEEVTRAVLGALGPRTKLLLIDHVTSATGLIFPVETIVREAQARGVDVLVDGAHAPGMLDLDLDALGAAYYTGNCHKWLCTPKGSALLHVRRDRQALIHPLVVSHGASSRRTDRSRFRLEFDFTGTDDLTAVLVIADAIRFLEGLYPGGWAELRAENRRRVLEGRALLLGALGGKPPAPDEMIGSLVALPLPDPVPEREGRPRDPTFLDPLQEHLFVEHRIEVPVFPFPAPPRRLIRIAAQAYNRREEYARLAAALERWFQR